MACHNGGLQPALTALLHLLRQCEEGGGRVELTRWVSCVLQHTTSAASCMHHMHAPSDDALFWAESMRTMHASQSAHLEHCLYTRVVGMRRFIVRCRLASWLLGSRCPFFGFLRARQNGTPANKAEWPRPGCRCDVRRSPCAQGRIPALSQHHVNALRQARSGDLAMGDTDGKEGQSVS